MNDLNWSRFEYLHQDSTTKFEQLCRILFKRDFFNETAFFKSDPNNPGIEIHPLYSSKTQQKISFQAKYFKNAVDYKQIMSSVEKTIQYYGNDLEVFYFYCNKDLTSTSSRYKKIKLTLEKAHIKFEIISNAEIINQILKYPDLQLFFFQKHTISRKWLSKYNQQSCDSLGARYNPNLNIHTQTEEKIQLFTKNKKAFRRINKKKDKLISDLQNRDASLARKAEKFVSSLDDINLENVSSYFNWNHHIKQYFSQEIKDLEIEIRKLNNELKNADILSSEQTSEIYGNIYDAKSKLSCLKEFGCSDEDKQLMEDKILFIKGDAGMGKSQLFATTTKDIMDNEGYALLLLGHHYLSNDNISSQIISYLNFDGSFSDFLNAIDVLGEYENKDIYIFIDAINETPNKKVWKNGLNKIFTEIKERKHIKVAISVRSGYETLVIESYLLQKIRNKEILEITHHGFREQSIKATKDFLNCYNIPFYPSDFLNYEMTNPLFLTLFCKTCTDGEMNIPQMFEKLIENFDKEIQESLEMPESGVIIKDLLLEIAKFQLNNNHSYITKDQLLNLSFWDKYGLQGFKLNIISALSRSIILNESILEGGENYFFGYNLLEDYIKAQAVMDLISEKEELKLFLIEQLLKIINGKIENRHHIDVFIFVCCFYFEKFSEDCIDIIKYIKDENDQRDLANRYIKSFTWRPSNTNNLELFEKISTNYPIQDNNTLMVLVENSTKENNPLNINFLHKFLFDKKLNERDSFWLPFINSLTYNKERVFQLISLFNKGEKGFNVSKRQTKMLLVLFAWFLASSNRRLRDITSKAMIEILKENFELCEIILRKFENVNDPYIIQRLYGIVFGACVKRAHTCEGEYKKLVEFVYLSIFDKKFVYADILLRDYARLIIERFLFEFPENELTINYSKLRPPYHSQDIPKVIHRKYADSKIRKDGLGWIEYSMHPEGVGIYGDFGRYIFQSSLNSFKNVDIKNLYHYAMQYIQKELGYTNELFAEYDTLHGHPLDRSRNHVIERIGKKYQWITFYNILARVSDRSKLTSWDTSVRNYKGAWEPYVRDFDPTLNCHFMKPADALPKFKIPLSENFLSGDSVGTSQIKKWINDTPHLFSLPIDINDDKGIEWVLLYQNQEIKDNTKVNIGEQRVWRIVQGYFVSNEQFDILKENIETKNFWGRSFPEGTSSLYQIFNREFEWSPSVNDILGDYWDEYKVEDGMIEEYTVINTDDQGSNEHEEQFKFLSKSSRLIAKVLPTYVHYSWEEDYDYSKDNASISFAIPCPAIVRDLHLTQKEYDSYFYSPSDDLVVFDGRLTKTISGLIIRKDYLKKFLKQNNLRIFWSCIGEKQYFKDQQYEKQIYSQWSGFYWMDETFKIKGNIRQIHSKSIS